jgi:hypothetical protein
VAAGTVTVFDQFLEDLGKKIHNLDTDTFNFALVDSTTALAATTADPRWGTGGTTNLSTNEVSGGNATAGGSDITSTYTLSGGTATFDGQDVSIPQSASNPTTARYGVIYNNTDTGKRAIAFVDLGAVTDLTAGDFTVTWNASGIFTLS